MLNALGYWFSQGAYLLQADMRWMLWNTFLALIPFALSGWLFKRSRSRSVFWWLGLFTFVIFLPNAPYVLTDIIHLVHWVRRGASIWVISLALVPAYLLFMAIGFEAYVVSVMRLGRYLNRWGVGWAIPGLEILTHALCAVGIYLGRFRRFNSWDLLTQPETVVATTINHLMDSRPLAIIAATFVVITVLYWVCKQITAALAWYWLNRHDWAQQEPTRLAPSNR